MLTDNLEPIPHFNVTDKIRVPVYKKNGDEYIVYLAKNYRRIYTLATLPLYVAAKITIANCLASDKHSGQLSFTKASLFTFPPDGGDDELCWKIDNNWYVVVLDTEDYNELQGERIDTREKSKNQSKKNS